MLTVALLGADGAGKTTVGHRLASELPFPVQYIYMGVNGAAASHALPTTRLVRKVKSLLGMSRPEGGPPAVVEPGSAPAAPVGSTSARAARSLRAGLRMTNRILEESYQQAVARWHVARGRVVVFDRYVTADYWAHDMDPTRTRTLSRRIHGLFLRHLCREPELVIVLDAPAEVLFARKGEGTLESLEQRRSEYLAFGARSAHLQVVDATAPLDEVVMKVSQVIEEAVLDRAAPGEGR